MDKPRGRGRPTSKALVRDEAIRRLDAGQRPKLIKEFANELAEWLKKCPDAKPMKPKTVENNIRDLWRPKSPKFKKPGNNIRI